MTLRTFQRAQPLAYLILFLTIHGSPAAKAVELKVQAFDQHGVVLEGIRFAFNGVESQPTTEAGVTGIRVPGLVAGDGIKLGLPRSVSAKWILIDSTVHVPAGVKEGPAEVVLVERTEIRKLAAATRDATGRSIQPGAVISKEQRRQILIGYARRNMA